MAEEEILEIEGKDYTFELPIAVFPPFKLRSSMVDKDPVIWVHLIEVYIQYVQTVLYTHLNLTEKSQQQLCLFVKSYMHEIAEEQGQILSLGLINVQITENLESLRAWMLELVKQLGVLRLKMNGEELWDFSKIFAPGNSTVIRGIIDGSYKPRDNRAISTISQVQGHIESLISNGKFTKVDLQTLAALINRAKRPNEKSQGKKQVKSRDQKSNFPDKFITVSWWEMLERLYAKGRGHFAQQCKEIGILSLISISINRTAALATELGITSCYSMGVCPLFAGIISNPEFHKLIPDLNRKLPFLKVNQKKPVDQHDVQSLIDMFPDLTITQTEKLLRKHDNSVESVTHLLLENPDSITKPVKNESSIPTADSIIQKKVINKQRTQHVPDEHKNRTLAAALRLMYESDEDEHDDTYDEAEATSGLSDGDQSRYDQIERYLWEIFKKDSASFERAARKTRKRKEMKDEIKWSDEQIEGWARMIQKSPKRAKILEEKYMFKGNKPHRSMHRSEQDEDLEEVILNVPAASKSVPGGNTEPVKRQQARNEKNKASRANHNRKSGHDKKMSRAM
jgi:hypothetical protein